MADQDVSLSTGHSQEQVAFMLLEKIVSAEHDGHWPERDWILRTYAECLITIQNPHVKWKP